MFHVGVYRTSFCHNYLEKWSHCKIEINWSFFLVCHVTQRFIKVMNNKILTKQNCYIRFVKNKLIK